MGTEDESQDQNLEVDAQGQEEISSESTGGINPAWNEVLELLPEDVHSQVTPHFSKWDQNYQNSIQKVHSQYEPYKQIIDAGFEPDQINYAMSVLQAIETQPQEVLKALQAYIGEEEEQGPDQSNTGSSETPDWLNHPEFQRVNEMVNTMAQLLVQQREAEVQAQQDAEFEKELKAVKDKFGEFDEEWVLTKMIANENLELEDAVKAYKEFVTGLLAKARQPGPKVLGAGGSVPNSTLDPSKLDDKGKRSLVVQMLENAKQQNQ